MCYIRLTNVQHNSKKAKAVSRIHAGKNHSSCSPIRWLVTLDYSLKNNLLDHLNTFQTIKKMYSSFQRVFKC